MGTQNPADQAFLERLTRFEAGEMAADELAVFEHELLDDPEKRAALVGHFEHGQRLRTVFQQQGCEERIVPFPPSLPSGGAKSRPRNWAPVALASAAALLVLGAVWFLRSPAPPSVSDSATNTPRLVFSQGASWSGEAPGSLGSAMTNGPWQLQSGIVRLEFADGTRATIEGPAKFNATGDKVVELSQGQLTANNEEGQGFAVVADGKRIETGRTSFGVQARSGHEAEVCVFRGEVEIGRDRQAPVVLAAGSIAQLDGGSGSRVMSANQRLPFQRNLVVTCGIADLDGTVLLFPSDLEHDLMEKEADGKVFLLPERVVRFKEAIPVSLVGAGSLSGGALESIRPWQASGPVRSFLLHASPSTRIEKSGSQSFSGSITFEHTIEAVIVSTKLLDASERLFGETVGQDSGGGRGLERLHGWEERARGRSVSDQVRVSEDRKTLAFELLVGEMVDQIRVLTAEK